AGFGEVPGRGFPNPAGSPRQLSRPCPQAAISSFLQLWLFHFSGGFAFRNVSCVRSMNRLSPFSRYVLRTGGWDNLKVCPHPLFSQLGSRLRKINLFKLSLGYHK